MRPQHRGRHEARQSARGTRPRAASWVAEPQRPSAARAPSSRSRRGDGLVLVDDPAGERASQPGGATESVQQGSERQTPAFRSTRSAMARYLPSPGALEFLDLPDDEVFFDPAKPIDEDGSVQVIHFMLNGASQQLPAFDCVFPAGPVEAAHDRARRTHDGRIEARDAEAAFFFELHALTLDEDRIDHDNQIGGAAA